MSRPHTLNTCRIKRYPLSRVCSILFYVSISCLTCSGFAEEQPPEDLEATPGNAAKSESPKNDELNGETAPIAEETKAQNLDEPLSQTNKKGSAQDRHEIETLRPSSTGITTQTSLLQAFKLPLNPKIMIIPVEDEVSTRYHMIDAWQAGFIARRLRAAKTEGYDLVILEIDTHGGSVAACEKIIKEIDACGVPVIAFVKGLAFSGGALIALGCKAIAMAPGTQIGGAQAVSLFGDLGKDHREKARSLLDAMVKGLCEKNGYPYALGRGMVDSEVEILETDHPEYRFITSEELRDWEQNEAVRGKPPRSIKKWKGEGQILSLTANEAFATGIAAAVVQDRKALLDALAVAPGQAALTEAGITGTERTARFLGHPVWLVLAAIVGLVALLWELKAPGTGVGFAIFGFCLGIFFWLAFFADSAGMFEIVLFLLGATLIGLEIFALPGFGFAGVSGALCLMVAIMLAFVPQGSLPNPFGGEASLQDRLFYEGIRWAMLVLFAIAGLILFALLSGTRFPLFGRIALSSTVGGNLDSSDTSAATEDADDYDASVVDPEDEYYPEQDPELERMQQLIGKSGVVETVLRPSGTVRVEGKIVEAVSDGNWVDPGTPVKVIGFEGHTIRVRELR